MGSSGFRLIPGNTCDKSRGKVKDEKVEKDCSQGTPHTVSYVFEKDANVDGFISAQPEEGEVAHQTVSTPSIHSNYEE